MLTEQLKELVERLLKLTDSVKVGDVWTEHHQREATFLDTELEALIASQQGGAPQDEPINEPYVDGMVDGLDMARKEIKSAYDALHDLMGQVRDEQRKRRASQAPVKESQ